MRLLITIAIVLLIAVSSYGYDLDSTRQARVQVYQLLGYDTTGVSGLQTGAVDRYVYMGVSMVNKLFRCREASELLTTSDGGRFIALDSCVYVTGCNYVSNDTTIGMRVINTDDVRDSILAAQTYAEYDRPEYVYQVGDSLRFLPTPKRVDTMLVHYIHVIPSNDTAISVIDAEYRDGSVFYAAYLSALDANSPRKGEIMALFKFFLMMNGRSMPE